MTDVYLWDETVGASDVVLRTSAAAAAVAVSSGGKPRRHMGESTTEPTPRGAGHLNFTLNLWGKGTIEARGELAATVAMDSVAHVSFAARLTFSSSVAIAAQAVTASDHINLRVSLAAIHPDDAELLELLELI